MNNIVSFNAASTSKSINISNASATKNLININLINSQLQKQTENTGVFSEDVGANLGDNPLAEYTLEELLKEGKETRKEIEDQRKVEAHKKAEEDRKTKEKELQELYDAREENNGLFHPKKEAALEEEIRALEEELGVDHKPDGWDKFSEVAKDAGATAVVAYTSIGSGVFKIYEYAGDGCTWVGGMTVSGVSRLVGADEFAEKVEKTTMDEIARDKVGELNKFIYEETSIGRAINDASYMKYDSKVAKGIQNATTEVTIIAGATAATLATGGAAAPLFAAGFVVGAGQSAEKNFQDTENRDFWKDSIEIGVDGTIKGLSTMAYGKAGATAVNGVKSISSLGISGIKEVGTARLKKVGNDILKHEFKNGAKQVLKQTAISTLKDPDMWLETGTVLLDNAKSGIQTGEWDIGGIFADAALIYGENYIGNLGGGYLNEVFDEAIGTAKVGQASYDIKEIEFNSKFANEPGDLNLDEAMYQQYLKVKKKGYNKSFTEFEMEYSFSSFDTNTGAHKQIMNEMQKSGATSIIKEDTLLWTLDENGAIGYASSGKNPGGQWATTTADQINLKNNGISGTSERAAKGIDRADYKTTWEIQFDSEYCKTNIDKFNMNGGSSVIGSSASAASMPGGYTYDLTGKGNGVSEFLAPRLEFSFQEAQSIINKINSGAKVIDLGNGIKFVKQ